MCVEVNNNLNIEMSEVLVNLAVTVANKTIVLAKNKYKDVIKKGDIDCKDAFLKYLEASYDRNSKIKTLLYRTEPKQLYSFYECVGVKYNNRKIDSNKVCNILEIGHKIIISGTGGIGKTTMLKHFFLNCVTFEEHIPILLELRSLNNKDLKEISIIDAIFDNLKNYGFDYERKYFEYSLETGCYLILFDGYDEVKQEKAETITREIINLCTKYPDNYYILSSRPNREFVGWSDFKELDALPLSKKQALSLIEKLDYDPQVKERFYEKLENSLYDKYKSFASNPLLLTIMLLTFENHASIPDKLNDFYEQAFITLFNAHDATKGAYKRDIKSGLGYDDFKSVFSYFCFHSYFKDKFEFTESELLYYINKAKNKLEIKKEFSCEAYRDDLVKSVCMLVQEGLNYRFSHRSFQEYFSALYITQLPDKTQEQLICSWLQEDYLMFEQESILYMLYDLQKDRFNMNVIYPGLLKARKEYIENGSSTLWIYNNMFGDMTLRSRPDKDNKEEKVRLSFYVKNQYFYCITNMICRIKGYKPNKGNQSDEIEKLLLERFGMKSTISLEQVREVCDLDKFFDYLPWFKHRFDLCMEYLSELESKNNVKYKKKFDSILDSL